MTTLEILQNRAGTAKRLQTIFAYHYDQILRECEQEIIEEVNSIYSDGESTFSSIKEIKEHFEEENPFHTSIVHLESQEISLQPNGTVIKDIEP